MWRAESFGGYLTEIDGYERDVERAAPKPRQIEEVADQPFQPLRLALDHLTGSLRSDDAVAETLRMTANGSQRCLQLVTDGEKEGALGVLRSVELVRQVVESGGELAQLGRALDRERVRALTLGKPPTRRRDPRHRSRDGTREEERNKSSEERAEQRSEREADEKGIPVGGLVASRAEKDDRVAASEPRRVQERLAADVDRAVGVAGGPQRRSGGAWQEQLRLLRREDGKPLLLGREKAADVGVPARQR